MTMDRETYTLTEAIGAGDVAAIFALADHLEDIGHVHADAVRVVCVRWIEQIGRLRTGLAPISFHLLPLAHEAAYHAEACNEISVVFGFGWAQLAMPSFERLYQLNRAQADYGQAVYQQSCSGQVESGKGGP